MGQVLEKNQIESYLATLRAQNKKIVFTNGVFDLLHVGHVRYLQEARSLGDVLFVGVNADASVTRLKGPTRPVQPEADRAEILAALQAVSFTCIFHEDTPANLIEMVRPDILVKGGDWKIESIVGAPFVMSYGGRVMSLGFVDGKSTTKIIEKSQKLDP